MSKNFEHAKFGSVPYLIVRRGDKTLARHLESLDHELMDNGSLKLSVFNDKLDYDLLFGRKIPVEGDHRQESTIGSCGCDV